MEGRKMRKIISATLIIAGIIVILYPLMGKAYNNYQRNKLMQEWVNSDNVEQDRNDSFLNLENIFNEDNEPKEDNYQPRMIGTIEIPKIDADVLIIDGTNNEDLKWGAGFFKGTAQIGEVGNTALAGHRSYTFGEIFNRLNEVEIGDEIIIKTKDHTYKYEAYGIKVIEPTDFSVLEPQGNKKILTLITCEPIYIASHRLIIHAELIE